MRIDELLPQRTRELRKNSFLIFVCECGHIFMIDKFGRDVEPDTLRIIKELVFIDETNEDE